MARSDDDEDRRAILSRRQRFVRLALAGLASATLGACDSSSEPSVCLGALPCPPTECPPPPPPDSGVDAGTVDSGTIVIRDAGGSDAGVDGGDGDAGDPADAG